MSFFFKEMLDIRKQAYKIKRLRRVEIRIRRGCLVNEQVSRLCWNNSNYPGRSLAASSIVTAFAIPASSPCRSSLMHFLEKVYARRSLDNTGTETVL